MKAAWATKKPCMMLAEPLQSALRTEMPRQQIKRLFISSLLSMWNQFSQNVTVQQMNPIPISSLLSDRYILLWHDMRARPRGPSIRSKRAATENTWIFNSSKDACLLQLPLSQHTLPYFSGGKCVLPSFLGWRCLTGIQKMHLDGKPMIKNIKEP